MTNIYNKKVLVKNGTLIGNWLEEQVLKEVSGEGRTIPGNHIPKRHLDFDNPIHNPFPKNNTNLRIIGTKSDIPYLKSNDNYGDFSCPENKYKKITINEKIFHDFFKTFIRNDGSERAKMEENSKKLKILEVYKMQEKSQIFAEIPDYFNNSLVGSSKFNQSNTNNINLDSTRNINILINTHNDKIDHSDPPGRYMNYYKDNEDNYWSNNLEKNINNNFAMNKINTFINPKKINDGKHLNSTSKLLEVITPKINSKFGHFDEYKNESYEKSHVLQSASAFYNTFDFYASIKTRIINACLKRGWIGFRKLRNFLKNLTRGKNNYIEKVNFKYLFSNYGIVFNDKEIDHIFQTYQNAKKGEVNFNEFLDHFNLIPENRLKIILNFFFQFKNNKDVLEYKILENNLVAEKHPEVISFKKTIGEIKLDFSSSWDTLRQDKIITEENFVYYFRDVSACIHSDEEFLEILTCLGFKNY